MHPRFSKLLSSAITFSAPEQYLANLSIISSCSREVNQEQTNSAFSYKWNRYAQSNEKEKLYQFQREWYLRLYGFNDEKALADYLQGCRIVLDAGCGLGYKSAWFARLAPETLIIGMDFSESVLQAANIYADIENLYFIQGDIGATGFSDCSIDFASCDQVIMHTEDPEATFAELVRITKGTGEVACYFYARKALPRELLDDYFRSHCTNLSKEELWSMSEQLTELGRRLSNLNTSIDVPAIPALGIKGGTMDIQRFIYWNFLKCFWNSDLGGETSIITNFDWYSPSNARRFTLTEVKALAPKNCMTEVFFHAEDACFSGRWAKT